MSRAQAFAAKHGIARVHDSYEALVLADPDVDAVYIVLPNNLHGRWTRAALSAGKHVLCEKPFTANAPEAREIAGLAAKSDRVVMQAFQYRYHPVIVRAEQIVASGELGKVERVEMPHYAYYCRSAPTATSTTRPCGWHDNGCTGSYAVDIVAAIRRFDPGSRFGTGETERS